QQQNQQNQQQNHQQQNQQQYIDAPSALRLAKRLYHLEGFQKGDVTRHLSKNNEYSRTVAEEYLRLFDFAGLSLDEAVRRFLGRFHLTGETQERERVLVYFSKRYAECNEEEDDGHNLQRSFASVDAIHTLTCALMLLNTDLHEENIQRKMTCADFILNLAGLNDGGDFSPVLLKALYHSIKQRPLGWNDANSSSASMMSSSAANCSTLCSNANPFIEPPNPAAFAIEYKKGYIRRKCCYEANGKRTALGRRGWRLFYATLRDLVLYLHRDENGFRKSQLGASHANSIRIHHAIAAVAGDYPKKKFVFRLVTADCAEYLFETSDSRELQSWVDTINTTAACLSAPALPSAVGSTDGLSSSSSSSSSFRRELLPVSHTKLSLRDQLADQERKLLSLQRELEQLLEKTGRRSTNKIYHRDFVERESYLQHEVTRYRTYIAALKWKLKQQQQQHQSAPSECGGKSSDSCGGSSSGHSGLS
ncbi:PREDICTED: PH and SEC7 domain-containing protein 3-like, partial [Rhagoletis zephyria]|uniref:PH and SEC7 domain-containing protein 3-like n=1 Tax=Rhagoletis zephyria TaxID=28612 RepID=UPI000811605F